MEPDPRDDLSGVDVARKVVILSREIGLPLGLDQIKLESLVPEPLQKWTPDTAQGAPSTAAQFVELMEAYDKQMSARIANAREQGKVLRYIGIVDARTGTASVELRTYDRTHPFAGLQLADNLIQIQSDRYHQRPLVIQGPGAGAAVTAAGVLADVLECIPKF